MTLIFHCCSCRIPYIHSLCFPVPIIRTFRCLLFHSHPRRLHGKSLQTQIITPDFNSLDEEKEHMALPSTSSLDTSQFVPPQRGLKSLRNYCSRPHVKPHDDVHEPLHIWDYHYHHHACVFPHKSIPSAQPFWCETGSTLVRTTLADRFLLLRYLPIPEDGLGFTSRLPASINWRPHRTNEDIREALSTNSTDRSRYRLLQLPTAQSSQRTFWHQGQSARVHNNTRNRQTTKRTDKQLPFCTVWRQRVRQDRSLDTVCLL